MKLGLFVIIGLLMISCAEKHTETYNHDSSTFVNYISLDGKKFMDGNKPFYPMILNYNISVINPNPSTVNGYYACPREGYHPFYEERCLEKLSPWPYNPENSHKVIASHLKLTKKMGFNTIRLTGFTPTDKFNNEFRLYSGSNISNGSYHPNEASGPEQINKGVIPLIKTILKLAEKEEIRVILLVSAVETQPENQLNYYSLLADGLKNEKALLGYDVYNEPIFFDRGDYTKQQTTKMVQSYNKAIKDKAPQHLTSIGLSHYKIVSEWDPELMDVDFLSFHVYPYASKNLKNLEKFESKMYWISQTITKPWVIGETGINTSTECDPQNLASGTYKDQLDFMPYSLALNNSAGSSGYSWWAFQDITFTLDPTVCPNTSRYGLLDQSKTDWYVSPQGDTIPGKLKHELTDLPFGDYVKNYKFSSLNEVSITKPADEYYYNIDQNPTKGRVTGKVLDDQGNGIPNAIITIYNHHSKTTYTTFSHEDGWFDLRTAWTDVFKKEDLHLKVAAVKKENTIIKVSGLNGPDVGHITLKDFKLD